MPESFNYKIETGITASLEPDVAVVKLGDSYEQRQGKGINPLMASYPVTVKGLDGILGRANRAREAEAFIRRQGAVQSFYWITPDTRERLLFVCRKWSLTKTGIWFEFSGTFEQVPR